MNAGSVVFKFEGDTKDIESKTKKIGTSVGDIIKGSLASKAIAKGIGAITSNLDGAVKRFDQLNQFPKVMKSLGVSAEDSQQALEDINKSILGLPTTLNQATVSVQRFVAKNGDVKKSSQYFKAMNDAILSGTQDTTLYNSALEQMLQAYSKGKPDIMEFRSWINAMPGQLKQVAIAMGYASADDLYQGFKDGNVTMEDFMETLVKLDSEGTGDLASFSESVKANTGGIETSITNMNTAIVRGIGNTFKALDESLSSSGLPTIVDTIHNITSGIDTVFKGFNSSLKSMDMNSIVSALQTSVPLLLMIPKNSSQFEAFGGILDSLGGSTSNFLSKWEKSGSLVSLAKKSWLDFGAKINEPFKKLAPTISNSMLNPLHLINSTISKTGGLLQKSSGLFDNIFTMLTGSGIKASSIITSVIGKIGGFPAMIAGKLASFAPTVIKGLGFAAIAGAVMTGIGTLDSVFGDSITQLLNKAITDGPRLITNFITGIVSKIPDLIAKATELIALFGQALITNLPAIVQGGVQLLSSLVTGIANSLPTLIPIVVQVIVTLVTALIENLPTIITAGIQLLLGLIRGIVAALPILIENIPKIISTLVTTLLDPNMLSMIISAGIELIITLAGALVTAIPTLIRAVPEIIRAIVNALGNLIRSTDWGSLGHNILQGVINGFLNFGHLIHTAVKRLGDALINGIKRKFGIHSPSRVMFEIGGYIDKGLINGIDSLQSEAQASMSGLLDTSDMKALSPSLIGTASTNLSPNIIVNNNVSMETDPLGQMVKKVKTFAGGAKNDYNYGMGA